MKNLMTRRIVLGLLMTCVLAFGVQGVTEAVTTTLTTTAESTSTIDISARQVGSSIGTISFTPTLEDTEGNPGTGTDTTNTNETITVSTSNIQLTAIASGTPLFTRSVTFSESRAEDSQTTTQRRLVDGTVIALEGYFTGVGRATLTIRYTDLADSQSSSSQGSTTSKSITHTYTYYVVQADDRIPETTVLRLTQGGRSVHNEGYITGLDGRTDFSIFSNNTGNYPVTYSVAGTPNLYFNDDPYTTTDPAIATTISSSSGRKVWLDMNGDNNFGPGGTSVVTVNIGVNPATARSSFNVAYIIGTPKLDIDLTPSTGVTGVDDVTEADDDLRNRYKFMDGTAGQTAGMIIATVHDGTATVDAGTGTPDGGTIEGVLVKFELQQKGSTTGYLRTTGTRVDARNNTEGLGPSPPGIAQTLYVRTASDGTATVTYTFGTLASQQIRVSSVGLSKNVTAEIGSGQTDKRISVKTNRRQSSNPKKYDLVAEVEDGDGKPLNNEEVTFSTDRGTLTRVSAPPATGIITTDEEVNVLTNDFGEAHVVYDIGDNTGRQEIRASFVDGTDRESVTFVINGSSAPRQTTTTTQPRLSITVAGEGATRGVIVNALDAAGQTVPGSIPVILSGTVLTTSRSTTTGAAVAITLPTAASTYTLIATDPSGNYAQAATTITVGTPTADGTLSIEAIGTPAANLQQIVEVTATNAAGTGVEDVVVTLSGPFFATRTVTTLADGSVRGLVTIPSATGEHTLTATAPGYSEDSVTLSAAGETTPPETTPPETTPPETTVAEPSSIQISGPATRSGVTVNQQLDAPLLVQVLDDDGNGVPDARVIFTRRTGQGRLSDRGAGRAIAVQTDARGFARADYTPESATSTVEAEVRGFTNIVTFTISTGSAPPTTTRDTGTGTTPGTTEISPVVHIGAANRPPMLWVDGGKIYALVGADVQEFGSGVEGAMNVAIGGGKIYWTEKTGDSAGTINSANLDGSSVTELKSILAVPMGIAVDVTNSKLYWTNSRGRIQSLNADGSGRVENVIPGGLEGAMDIALAGGNAYWTQGGNVRFVNLTGQKQIRNISTGTDTTGSLVIGGGKVYWTEMTGERGGTVNSANLNGSGATQLASILAAPSGIAVDNARSKLYWTNSRGRIQSANLNGSRIQNVVDGLGNPGDMVLSNSISAPVATTTTTTTTTTPTTANYDVDESGSVDNVDVFLVALAVGTSNAKYDVNGDGKVDDEDIALVRDNRDSGAAAAPMIFGAKLTADQVDRLQEQIDLLVVSNDRSPATLKTLVYLQQLLMTARPEKTQLLANYPNPFNPETWIPYELATDTNVKITIYNTHGVVIRTLELGHQSAGYYTGRESAAYWDGRNALGEQVASGIYFYQFETGEMSSMRKMVILK